MFRHILASLLALMLILTPWVHAATYHVATNGNDTTGNGSLETPWRTTQRGFQALQPGDILYIRAGTWPQIRADNHTMNSGSSWANAPQIRAYPGETVMLRGIHVSANRGYFIWDGFVVDTASTLNEAIYMSQGAHHLRFQNMEIKNAIFQGVLVTSTSTGGHEFSNLNIHLNGSSRLHHGMYISAPNNLIEYCRIHHNAGFGIHIFKNVSQTGETPNAHNNIVRFNTVHNNGTAQQNSGGIVVGSGQGSLVQDNKVYNNTGAGILVAFNALNQIIERNTIYSNTTYGVELQTTSTTATVRNNLVTQNSLSQILDNGVNTTKSNNPSTGDTCVGIP
jgi:hypothetical protein